VSIERLIKVVEGNYGSRRITIPKRFVEELKIGEYLLVRLVGNHLEIFPVDIEVKEGRE